MIIWGPLACGDHLALWEIAQFMERSPLKAMNTILPCWGGDEFLLRKKTNGSDAAYRAARDSVRLYIMAARTH